MMPPRTGTSPERPSRASILRRGRPRSRAYGDLRDGTMTVEALRRRRPETLGELLETYGRELQSVAYLILRDRGRGRGRRHRDAPHRLREAAAASATSARCGRGSCASPRTRPWACAAGPVGSSASRSSRSARRPATSARSSSTRIALLDGIADLPVQMRAAVVLRYYADLGVDEIAATLGKSPNTIKAQLQTGARPTSHPPCRPGRHQPRGGPTCMTRTSRSACAPSSAPRATTSPDDHDRRAGAPTASCAAAPATASGSSLHGGRGRGPRGRRRCSR